MIDSGRLTSETRLLTLFDLAQANSLGAGLGADFPDGAPAPNPAADFQLSAVSVAGDAPTVAADGALGPASVSADGPAIGADGPPASVAADLG